ncbi:hypothetical protein HZY97_04695 [Sphingomonas sp. R-74633]|uniref:hypothetical protein n=1 Tax=Sphingomonas sp. R-74633 TaxID=2751188 RepID=UPI0015D42786|nr:hypothetical protein [Sphingomonas sp. R-74633]NYT40043.1 hypothetical protein [Sphingomonas sp. R-74633]
MKSLGALLAVVCAMLPVSVLAQGGYSLPTQSAQLLAPQTPAERITCINALRGYRLGGHDTLKLQASIMYLAMKNAHDDLQGKTLSERYLEILSELQNQPLPDAVEAESTMKRCYDADPLTSGNQTRPLPTNAFRRDLVCRVAILLVLQSTQRFGGTPERTHLAVVQKRFEDRTGPERYYENGLRTQEAMDASVAEALTTSLSIGTTDAIANTCAELQ